MSMMSMSSSRPFAVVTGASSGIGFELAKQFASHGYDLLIAAEDSAIDTAAANIGQTGVDIQTVQCDLATREGVDMLYDRISACGRPVDAIAINAGVGVGGSFLETSLEAEMNMINLNVMGTYHLAKHVARDMCRRGEGRILITASIASTMPAPFEAVYAATKAFDLSLADALRNELKEYGVSVTALMPGPVETNFFHRAGLDNTKVGQSEKDDPADVARQGFEALMAGDAHIIAASFKNKLMGMMNEITPEAVKAQMHRKMAEPVSDVKKAS